MSAVAPDRVPSFEWTRDALVEHCGERTYVYGRWDRLFGCWRTDGYGKTKPFAPTWPLLDRRGRPALREANTAPDTAVVPSLECPEYLFARYAELIPRDVRRIVGAFASWQWVVLAMVRDEPAFANFLATELRCRGPGFVSGCLALAAAHTLGRLERNELCRRLMHEKRANMVASVTGSPHGRALAGWLGKLDAEAATTELCVMLLVVAEEDPIKSRLVGHLPSLTFPIVWSLLRVPSWACSVRLVELLAGCTGKADSDRADDLLDLLQFVESCCPHRKRDLAMVFSRARNLEQLFRGADDWRSRVADAIPFPPAPLPARRLLRPLTSALMMRAEGLRMRNCVGRLAWQVVDGGRYFYQWRGVECATISLARDLSGRWQLDEMAGADNRPLAAATSEEIEAVLRAAAVDTGQLLAFERTGPAALPGPLDEAGESRAGSWGQHRPGRSDAPTSGLAGPEAGTSRDEPQLRPQAKM